MNFEEFVICTDEEDEDDKEDNTLADAGPTMDEGCEFSSFILYPILETCEV